MALAQNEHWVCGARNKLEPSHTDIFDWRVEGDELVAGEKSAASGLRYKIMRNDARVLIGVWLPAYTKTVDATVMALDKQSGAFKITLISVGGENVVNEGNCRKGD
jgi:hypothetical protein